MHVRNLFIYINHYYYEEFEIYEKLDRILYWTPQKSVLPYLLHHFFLLKNLKQVLYIISLWFFKKKYFLITTLQYSHVSFSIFLTFVFSCWTALNLYPLLVFLCFFGFCKDWVLWLQVRLRISFAFWGPSAKEVGSREGKCIESLQGVV